MSEDLNKLRELAESLQAGSAGFVRSRDFLNARHDFIDAANPAGILELFSRLQAAEERAEKAEIDLAVIHRAAQHCCGRFGGRMSEIDRIFQEITRVSSMHKTRAALKTEGA